VSCPGIDDGVHFTVDRGEGSGMNFARRPNGQRPEIHSKSLARGGGLPRKARNRDFSARLIMCSIDKYHLGRVDEITRTEVHMLVAVPGA
jgi:hypothetical protein